MKVYIHNIESGLTDHVQRNIRQLLLKKFYMFHEQDAKLDPWSEPAPDEMRHPSSRHIRSPCR